MRSRSSRARAERALGALVAEVGPNASSLTVIGGLNADLLTDPDPHFPHQGTVDVDVLLEVGFVWEREDERDFAWLEEGLVRAGFSPSAGDGGWRWQRTVDGASVRVELLCDTPDNRGQAIALPGCREAAALNLQGPAAARHDVTMRWVPIGDATGGASAEVAFAGLGGYLVAKASAFVSRRYDKDLYDWMYVALHNTAGGPWAAGRAIAAVRDQMRDAAGAQDVVVMLDQFVGPPSRGTSVYAAQRLRDGEASDADLIAQDAVGAALEVRRALAPVPADGDGR